MKLLHKFWSVLTGLACCLFLLILLGIHNAAPVQAYPTPSSICPANPDWVTNPSLPSEIPNAGNPNLCDFYQFSWQSFLYLMSPSQNDPSLRNFQDTALYPTLQVDENSCSSNASTPTFLIRTVKEQDDSGEFLLPERIGQAGGGATIYDQNGNVVFYSISFGRDLCNAPQSGNLPENTIELKIAWKVLEQGTDNEDDYLSIQADVIPETGSPIPETLGLIGFHLVRSTPTHPEMIWATFDHKNNAPTCHYVNDFFTNGFSESWSFLSPSCSTCLYIPSQDCFNSCQFNQAQPATSLTTTNPSEICVAFPNGTAPNAQSADQNNAVINDLNTQLVGGSGIVTELPASNPLAVIQNYFNLGAVWMKPDTTTQVGSLQLANPVMETTFQGDLTFDGGSIIPSTTKNMFNCFACHQYKPGSTATSGLSHIFDEIRKYDPLPSGSN